MLGKHTDGVKSASHWLQFGGARGQGRSRLGSLIFEVGIGKAKQYAASTENL